MAINRAFTAAADAFCQQTKVAVGHPGWGRTRDGSGRSIYWTLEINGQQTRHRLHVEAYPASRWRGFTVLVELLWQDREVPIFRLNQDDPAHEHVNRFDRPLGVPPVAHGNREYLWADNRRTFNPDEHLGLPYARQLTERGLALDNAIRHISGMAQIDLSQIVLPDYPPRDALV